MSDGGDGRADGPRADGSAAEPGGIASDAERRDDESVPEPGERESTTGTHGDGPVAERGDDATTVGPRTPDAGERDCDGGTGDDPSVAAVFGARPEDAPPRPEIVPEAPSPENVAFVLLGVAVGLFAIWRAVTVFAP